MQYGALVYYIESQKYIKELFK